jgi:hypothetical protein
MRHKVYVGTFMPAWGGAQLRFSMSRNNDALHRILNEWADIIPAQSDTYPLIDGKRQSGCRRSGETVKSNELKV